MAPICPSIMHQTSYFRVVLWILVTNHSTRRSIRHLDEIVFRTLCRRRLEVISSWLADAENGHILRRLARCKRDKSKTGDFSLPCFVCFNTYDFEKSQIPERIPRSTLNLHRQPGVEQEPFSFVCRFVLFLIIPKAMRTGQDPSRRINTDSGTCLVLCKDQS